MKLTEAILLFESFRDLKRIFRDAYIDVIGKDEMKGRTAGDLKDKEGSLYFAYSEVASNYDRSRRSEGSTIPDVDITTADGLFTIIKWAAQHPTMVDSQFKGFRDTGPWIKTLRRNDDFAQGLYILLMVLVELIKLIRQHESDPDKQKPKIITIKKTSDYEVYRLDNYAAARKVCTTFNTNFCIGANHSWYTAYGEDAAKSTFAITLPNRTVVIVHAGSDGYLITSHDNKSEINDSGNDRGDGAEGVAADFVRAGLSFDTAIEAISYTISSQHIKNVKFDLTGGFGNATSNVIADANGTLVERWFDYSERDRGVFFTNKKTKKVLYVTLIGSGANSAFMMANREDMVGMVRGGTKELLSQLRDIGIDNLASFAGPMERAGGASKTIIDAVIKGI